MTRKKMTRLRINPIVSWVIAVVAIVLQASGCAEQAPEQPGPAERSAGYEPLTVFTVNYPLKYFAERIGGGRVRVAFPAPPDIDPAFWSPEPETVVAFQGADLILLNGANYAKWIERASLPEAKLIDTSAGFRDRYLSVESAVVHTHGPEGAHSHGELAFTTWLDPDLALEQSRVILDAFVAARPEGEAMFQAGFDSLERDFREWGENLEDVVAGSPGLPLLGSHPVYQYLAQRFSLNLESVHFEPDEVPAETEWRKLMQILQEHPARWMLWEREPLTETVDKLRSLGVSSIVFDPCGNTPPAGDFLSVMESNLRNLRKVFAGS
jgi:zinc transport system substrate-binding protein